MSGAVLVAPEPDDNSLAMLHEMQRDYLRRGGTSMPAVMKMGRTPYVHQDYPKHVRVGLVELGIADSPEGERALLEAHVRATGAAVETVRTDNAALTQQAALAALIATWSPEQVQAALAAVKGTTAATLAPPPVESTPVQAEPQAVAWEEPKAPPAPAPLPGNPKPLAMTIGGGKTGGR